MTDRDTFAPLVFFEYDHKPGSFCLMLSDQHMLDTEKVFTDRGYDGCGYGWAGVARSAVRSRAPELTDRFGLDPEAGMFVAYGEDADALRALAPLLVQALEDHRLLGELIDAGEPDWFD